MNSSEWAVHFFGSVYLFSTEEKCATMMKTISGDIMKSTRFWVILIAAVLALSVAASIFVYLYHGSGNVVAVYHHGELVERIHLDTVTTPYSFTVGNEEQYNVVTVEQGRICVSEATCPDHVCIHTGWLSDGAVPIVCLPNELVIQLEGTAEDSVDRIIQ